ncbi:hypothetical protein PRIPAC_90147 [Pristionchus pacificus]|uniref:Uncharacterized protein n=1 Tax=Pristionchus pacificus TaxID=54126 RepID=A0A2A6B7G1_PRIPA|nr:hypothetical protein PRIPAC_90147 [Pristionchus pacificus]|eukprot:PDM61804.1 hypothetical protein PRIPAC_51246 [Pristionchus pacificus]
MERTKRLEGGEKMDVVGNFLNKSSRKTEQHATHRRPFGFPVVGVGAAVATGTGEERIGRAPPGALTGTMGMAPKI